MTITEHFTRSAFLLQPAEEKKAPAKQAETVPTTVCEPERRLWKLSSSLNSTKVVTIEFVVFALFLILACAGMVVGFAELSHLLQSDSVGHVATQAINGGS